MQTPMSSCFVSPSSLETPLKTFEKNGGMKLRDTVKVRPLSTGFQLYTLKTNVGVKLALVALKCDLREDEATKERLARYDEKCVSYDEGLAMAKYIKAVRYLGTTSLGL